MKNAICRLLVLTSLLLTTSGCSWLTSEKRIRESVAADYAVGDAKFRHTMSGLMSASLVEGNNVVELLNGDQIFGSMLEAIRGAKHTITIEHYIWSSGKVTDQFVEALNERARAGVKIHILVDALGSLGLSRKDRKSMVKAGAQLAKYNRPFSFRFFRSNYRTHRKLMVVDGKVGFIGGVCVSDDWSGNADPPHWRDTHFRVEGPVVGQIQAVFMENWMQMQSEVLHGDHYFPAVEKKGSMLAQCVKSGPREGSEMTRLGYLLSIAAARNNIRIAHSYFAPDTLMIQTLLDARKRGIKIEVIVPHKSDNFAIKTASKPRWGKLLEAGVEFYEYWPTLYHCKIVIVDDVWSIVGSVNFDERSFRLNDEVNLQVLDREFAAELIKTFEDDKKQSTPLTFEKFKKRPFWTKMFDHFAGLFRSQL